MRTSSRLACVAALAAGLVVSACAESESTTTEAPASTEASSTEVPTGSDASTSTVAEAGPSAPVQWGIDYIGGTAAEATGDPIRIGYASDGNLFPDSVVFADATADYINKYLGGIDGRPIEIVHCNMSVPEDGATCATQFANDDSVVLAMVGQALVGTADFYTTINGKKPVYTGSPSGIDDFLSTVSVSYLTGDRKSTRLNSSHT